MKTTSHKGQGLTVYGIILPLIVVVEGSIWFHTDMKGQLSAIYGAITSNMKSIVGDEDYEEENYDTTIPHLDNDVVYYETTLHFNGNLIYWYTDPKTKIKQYTYQPSYNTGFKVNILGNGEFSTGNGRYTGTDAEGKTYVTVFFKASDDNNIYQMISYGGSNNTTVKLKGNLPFVNIKQQIIPASAATSSTQQARLLDK